MIECRLCGKQFKRLTQSHLKYVHSMTCAQYHELFPGEIFYVGSLHSEETKLKVSKSLEKSKESRTQKAKVWHRTHESPKSMLGRKHSEESKCKIRESSLKFYSRPENCMRECHRRFTGCKHSQEELEKMIYGVTNYCATHPEEVIARGKEISKTKQNWSPEKRVEVGGKISKTNQNWTPEKSAEV